MDKTLLVEVICEEMNAKKIAEIEQYPDCCADAFIERSWDRFVYG